MDLWSKTFDLDFLVRVLNFTINRPIMVTPPTTLSPSPEKLGSVGGLMIECKSNTAPSGILFLT